MIVLSMLVSAAAAQDPSQDLSPSEDVEPAPASDGTAGVSGQPRDFGFWGDGPRRFAGAIPTTFKRHFLTRFSVGETYERGISNGERIDSIDTNTNGSLAFHYDLKRRSSEYTLDYNGTARDYHRVSRLDVVSHEAGLGQVVQWTPRLMTALRYRYSHTPDISEHLLQETVSQDISLADPSAVSQPLAIPAEQALVTLRTVRKSSTAEANLAYQASPYTRVSIGLGYGRLRYQDNSFHGSERAGVSAQIEHALSPRTAVGIGYDGERFRQPAGLDRTIAHRGSLSLSRKLTRYSTVKLSAGRLWSYSGGSEVISLSPVLADMFGTPTLLRRDSRFFASWTGSANLLTHWQWRRVNFGFVYARSITNNNLLGSPANTQSFTVTIGRLLGRSTRAFVSMVYQQNDFITFKDSHRLDQGVVVATVSRPLIGGLDLSIFFNYAKLFKGVERPFLFDHMQGGVRLSYQFPRMRPS
jgi:hypothetical protein